MRNLSLLTDYYELLMMQGIFLEGKSTYDRKAIFDMFYRQNPNNNGFSIFAGVEQLVDYIENLHFEKEDIDYLRKQNIFKEEFLNYLKDFKFSGSIYSFLEGSVIFPREPLVKVVAPLIQTQLIESALLNIINHESLIATKAYRVCKAANGDKVMEFGLRRAQGPDAGIFGARAAIIGGCVGTSNVLTGKMFDVDIMGTMAHSWIMAFSNEEEAFKKFVDYYPNNAILLVDTYDTLKSGIPNAIKTFQYMEEKNIPLTKYGIRLDSGDLAYLSIEARKMLDEAGFTNAIICASNDLDEDLIQSLKMQNAKITLWGVGTKLITSSNQASFGGVYKLVAIEDEKGELVPKIKLSDSTEKITNPGDKEVLRIYDNNEKIFADLIKLKEEQISENDDLELFDPIETWKRTTFKKGTYKIKKVMHPLFENGKKVYENKKVIEIQEYTKKELSTLWEGTLRLTFPHEPHVDLSQKLWDMKNNYIKQKIKDWR
ncbi:MAG: nicotinate phosphoribosyltransferase [Eubacteriales bacterium]|nr:nicotinate phosphoribosyltransferase [Eubacteriales bacterium]